MKNLSHRYYQCRTGQMAQDTLDLLDALQWRANVHVVGVSMGGMIAQELVLTDPKRFASLCLTSTNAGRAVPPFSALSFVSRVSLVKPESRPSVIVGTLFTEVKMLRPTFFLKILRQAFLLTFVFLFLSCVSR